ncbi:MAG: glycosyltransferase, partial [Saprospiraceae bacterium]|nr:glycosyltransferase [Saprospiraceae bacterium]
MTMILLGTVGGGLILTGVYYYYFNAILSDKSPGRPLPHAPVSVLVCVKDGLPDVRENLVSWCRQDYPEYEVLVIDDHSSDDLAGYVTGVMAEYPGLRYVPVPLSLRNVPGKKAALQFGLKQATHQWVLLTDADCYPNSQAWITTMMADRGKSSTLGVLGYSPMRSANSRWSVWMAFETAWVAMQYLGFAARGEAYMGVGRNLLIQKEAAI